MDTNANTKNANCPCTAIRAVAHLDIQYAHRFNGFKGEARYLHGHTGGLTLTVEGFIRMVYELLKDRLNIVKITFTSGVNAATATFPSHLSLDRCPDCGIALKDGACPKFGYRTRPAAT